MLTEKLRYKFLDGMLTDYTTFMAGIYKGYAISVKRKTSNVYCVSVFAHSENDPQNRQLNSFLEQLKSSDKSIKAVSVKEYLATLEISAHTTKSMVQNMDAAVKELVNYLEHWQYTDVCENCGREYSEAFYNADGNIVWLCPDCAAESENNLAQTKAYANIRKSNLIAGLVGAFLGALIGAVLQVVSFQLGFISTAIALSMAILALMFYEKLGGCLDVKGIICTAIMLAAMVFFTNKLAWSVDAYFDLKEYGWTFSDCFRELEYLLKESELKIDYISDLIIRYFITFIGAYGFIINALKTGVRAYTFKKL